MDWLDGNQAQKKNRRDELAPLPLSESLSLYVKIFFSTSHFLINKHFNFKTPQNKNLSNINKILVASVRLRGSKQSKQIGVS